MMMPATMRTTTRLMVRSEPIMATAPRRLRQGAGVEAPCSLLDKQVVHRIGVHRQRGAGRIAVLLEDIGRQLCIDGGGELTGRIGRHRGADEREQPRYRSAVGESLVE